MKNKQIFNKRQTRCLLYRLCQLYITVVFACYNDLTFNITISITTTKR